VSSLGSGRLQAGAFALAPITQTTGLKAAAAKSSCCRNFAMPT
jgi:hypothetical protein